MKRPGVLLLLSSVLLLAACDTTPVADKTAPSITLEASPSTVPALGTVTLKATASDNVAVTKVSFYRGATLVGEDNTAPYTAADILSASVSGKVSYRAVAIDAAGNKAEATAETVVAEAADETAPSITLEASPSSLSTSGTVALKATATDNKGVSKVSFYRGDTLLSTDQTAPYEASDPVTVQGRGSVSYRAVAEDAAGNKAEAKKAVSLSLTAITGTIVEGQPQVAADGTPTLALTAWTGGSGTVDLTIYDMQGQTINVANGTLAADGTFGLSLPDLADNQLQEFNLSACQNVTISDPRTLVASATVRTDADKDGPVMPRVIVGSNDSGPITATGVLIYVNHPVTIDGTCTWYYLTEKFNNLTLQEGWNKIQTVREYGTSNSGGTITDVYSNINVTGDWVYMNAYTGDTSVTAQSLKAVNAQNRILFK